MDRNNALITKKIQQILYGSSQAVILSVLFSHLTLTPYAHAGPTGANIVGGQGHIHQTSLNTLIHQQSDRLAIDWQSFNLNQNESVRFDQPDISSIALNRITDLQPTKIQGSITSNGQIILVNPNGIFFSKTAFVDVGGLLASGLDINPQKFMQGQLDFSALEKASGLIVNEGTLQALDEGSIALIGKRVRNEGIIMANFGRVSLAAGSDISVAFDDQNLLNFTINQNVLADTLGVDDPAIFNSGLIEAHGGQIILSAKQAKAIQHTALNTGDQVAFSSATGQVIEADGGVYFAGPDGDISNIGEIIVADEFSPGSIVMEGGNINNAGIVNADGQYGNGGTVTLNASDTTLLTENSQTTARSSQQGKGGVIHLLGKNVGLMDKALVDASGANGGGTVLMGGDYQGKNPDIKNADAVYLGKDTQIKANAIKAGDGGEIIVWSEKSTRAYGSLSATGGEQSGDGGFIETPSKQFVDLVPTIDDGGLGVDFSSYSYVC